MLIEPDKIYHGDCLELMSCIEPKSVDMVCCDLPYGVLSKNNDGAKWDRILDIDALWKHYRRIVKDNGAIVLFGQGMFSAGLMMSNPLEWRYNLVWDKVLPGGFLNSNRMPLRRHEDIIVFYKKLPTYNPQFTKGEPNHPKGSGKHKQTNNCYGSYAPTTDAFNDVSKKEMGVDECDKYPTSIVSFKKERGTKLLHPTQKPVDLVRWLIRTYTNEGDIVLDNCCGSGTTAVAAMYENRKFICIEKDDRFFEMAKQRIENERLKITEEQNGWKNGCSEA